MFITTQTHVINSSMAIAVDQCHGFKPTIHNRRCRLRSFPHLDISPLDLDPALNHQFTRHPPLNLDLTTTTTTSPPPATSPNIHRSFSSPCWSTSSCSANSNNNNVIAGAGGDHHHHHHDQAYSSSAGGGHNNNNIIPRLDVIGGHGNRSLRALVVEAAIAMASGMQLIPVAGGLGGSTYCLRNRAGENLAVLKPIMDQDDHHLSLISGGPDSFMLVGRPPGLSRHSIRAAHTAMSEVAAYLLDHGGFSGVPPTALVKVSHGGSVTSTSPTSSTPPWKIASIQRFVAHDYDAGDVGPSRFSVPSVHRIGILDVRLLNIDRHTGNILVKNHVHDQAGCCLYGGGGGGGGDCELVPIDHELCLPEKLDDPYFEWLHWPQASVPFSESEAEYISSLNPLRDAELLRAELPMLKEASIRVLVLCTVFLKRAAEAGLCLADIGGMMTREYQNMSQLEALCRRAQVGMAKVIFMRKMIMIKNNIHDKVGGAAAAVVVEDHSGLDDHDDHMDDDDNIDQYYFTADDDGGPAGLISISTDHQNIIMGAVEDEGPHSFLWRGKKPPKVPKKTLSMKVTSTVTGEYSANYYYCPYSATTTTTGKFGKDDGDQEDSIDRDEYQGGGHRGSSELIDRVNIGIRSEPINGGGGRFLSKSTSFCASRSYIGLHQINGGFDSEKYYSAAAAAAGISFQGLSEGEWKLFMEKFEELLPSAFEARKGGRRA